MCADCCQLATANHQDQVRPADLREAVGDDKGGSAPGSCINGALDLILGSAVDGARGIIQYQNAWSVRKARASARRWRCPPKGSTPRSPTTVS